VRRLFLVVFGLTSFGCQLLQGALNNPVGAANDLAAGGLDAKAHIDDCAAFSQQTVAYSEEVSIGGAIALNLGGRVGAPYVELSPQVADLTQAELAEKFKNAKPTELGQGPKTDLTKYINTLGKGLASFSTRPNLEWTFTVLDSTIANAFSAPGGYVFITTGMLKSLDNEAQLAGVLAHEIGHVTGRHALTGYKEAKRFSCLSAYFGGKALDGATSAALGALASNLQDLPFKDEVLGSLKTSVFDPNGASGPFIKLLADHAGEAVASSGLGPDQERDADATAAKLMIFAGYDVREFESLLGKLPDGAFLTPHPSNASRVAVVAQVRQEFEDFAGHGKAPAIGATVKAIK
jgi:hypothetical protein